MGKKSKKVSKKDSKRKLTKRVSKIGGQAVLEGVMMRGETVVATAVRDEFNDIVVESNRVKSNKQRNFLLRLPFVRGVVAFLMSMITGTKILMRSAEVWGGDLGEPSKLEKWLSEKFKIEIMDIAMFFGLIIGLGLSISLFFLLPSFLTQLITKLFHITDLSNILKSLIEGFVRISIFLCYIISISFMKDIKRIFMYHGAEHKVIHCYEHNLELTVENAQKMSTLHDRCGTNFLFIVMIISILVLSFFDFPTNVFKRVLTRLIAIPITVGISYELLKIFAKSDNFLFRIFKFPGLMLQKITTSQPTDEMVEVSLTAFKTVLAMQEDKSIPECTFEIKKNYKNTIEELEKILKDKDKIDIEWIICSVTGNTRSEIKFLSYLSEDEYNKAIDMAKERAKGKPLQYIIGDVDFYNINLKVDNRVLIPRPETETLVENVINDVLDTDKSLLDLCTGSGAIALSIKKNCSQLDVSASDISNDALELAKENAVLNDLDIKFSNSNLFENINGKYDIITSNPPYIETKDIESLQSEVKDYEPMLALDGGEDGLDIIRKIADNIKNYLNNNGRFYMEIGYNQFDMVSDIFESKGFKTSSIKDLEGIDRILKAEL